MTITVKQALGFLSFVGAPTVDPNIRLWQPPRTGDSAHDFRMGRNYADELVQAMVDAEAPNLLIQVIKAIKATPEFGPLEIAFLNRIAEYAMQSTRNLGKSADVVPFERASNGN